jgi:hypothetical protein
MTDSIIASFSVFSGGCSTKGTVKLFTYFVFTLSQCGTWRVYRVRQKSGLLTTASTSLVYPYTQKKTS